MKPMHIRDKVAAIIALVIFAGATFYSFITKDYSMTRADLIIFFLLYIVTLTFETNRHKILPLVPAILSLLPFGVIWVASTMDLAVASAIGIFISNAVTIGACHTELDAPKEEATTRLRYACKYWLESYADGTMDEETRTVAAFLHENATGKVIDFGCGPSFPLWWLAMSDADELDALDVAPESFTVAKALLKLPFLWLGNMSLYWQYGKNNQPAPGWEEAAAQHLRKINRFIIPANPGEIPDDMAGQYDTVVCIYSMGSQKTEEELVKSTRAAASLLKPGGKIIHINTNGENPQDELPEYCWNGLENTREVFIAELLKLNFLINVDQEFDVREDPGCYNHSKYYILSATNCFPQA